MLKLPILLDPTMPGTCMALAGDCVLAFGNSHQIPQESINALAWRDYLCLGQNNDGTPKHPLYRNDTPLVDFRWEDAKFLGRVERGS